MFAKNATSDLAQDADPPTSDHVTVGVSKIEYGTFPVASANAGRARRGAKSKSSGPDVNHEDNMRALVEHMERQHAIRINTYTGTRLIPGPSLPRAVLGLQREIIAAFGRLDPKPPERAEHFRWVTERGDLNPVGWVGCITALERRPQG